MSLEFLDCLKRERDIRIKPKLRGGKTAFTFTPALRLVFTGGGVGVVRGVISGVISSTESESEESERFYFLPILFITPTAYDPVKTGLSQLQAKA